MNLAPRILLLGLALLLILPAATGAGATEEEPSTVDRTIQLTGQPGSGPMVPVEAASCSGSSPLLYICTTGAHQTSSFISLQLSATNYQGTLENRLDWNFGLTSLVFRCVIDGATAECTISGPLPDPGTLVVHNCRSLDSATGLPGGTGSWSCGFST